MVRGAGFCVGSSGDTVFNVPDLRETTIVGIGKRDSGVTAHDTYTLGQFKDDQMQGHTHTVKRLTEDGSNLQGCYNERKNSSIPKRVDSTFEFSIVSDGTNGDPRTGTTTHGKQMGLNYIIKT